MRETPAITLAGVDQVFTRDDLTSLVALRDLTFEIGAHEFVAVLGPSGCGKSTLLRLISGLVFPTGGRIEVYRHNVTEPRDDVGIVFQKPTLLPWCNVIKNVTFPFLQIRTHLGSGREPRARTPATGRPGGICQYTD